MTDASPVEPEKDPSAGSPRPPPAEPKPKAAEVPTREPESADSTVTKESFPRWKKVLLAAAAAVFLLGLLLRLTSDPQPAPPGPAAPGSASALVDGETVPPPGSETGVAAWSPGLMALGFSFFVGFAVGSLLRAFVKITLLIAGLLFLALAGLSHVELITVHWEAMDQIFQAFGERVGSDFDHLSTIVTGRLPQTGLGALGLFTGFKKR